MANLEVKNSESETPTDISVLQIADPEAVKSELHLFDFSSTASTANEQELTQKADSFIEQLFTLDPKDLKEAQDEKAAIENLAVDLQKRAAQQGQMLKEPLKKLGQRGTEGGEVAKSLLELKIKVEELDPAKVDFQPGWFSRTMGKLPGVGTPLKRYFSRYESAQTAIAAIIQSLQQGRDQLARDNITLQDDQQQMRDTAQKLEKAAQFGKVLDQRLEAKIERQLDADPERKNFLLEEILFPLRQRILDLQQQLAVQQQGILASEVLQRNNRELMRGVDRTLRVTITALEVAVTVALALEHQKIVLDKIQSVNQTTSNLIAGTAARLKTQGTAIHQQAASAQLDLGSLKSAFNDIHQALDDLGKFRQNALPQMAQTILEMDQLSVQAAEKIQKLEAGNQSQGNIQLEVE